MTNPESVTTQGGGRFAAGCAIALAVLSFAAFVTARVMFPIYRNTTGSMEPTLANGDGVITDRSSSPAREDLIAFRYPLQPETTFLKRVIGLPGEVIEIRDKTVYINGVKARDPHASHVDTVMYPNEPALPEPYKSRDQFGPLRIPPESFFVMGDNRDRSSDSRYWGTLPRKNIRGKAILVLSAKRGFWRP